MIIYYTLMNVVDTVEVSIWSWLILFFSLDHQFIKDLLTQFGLVFSMELKIN